LHRFLQQVRQFDGAAAAGFEGVVFKADAGIHKARLAGEGKDLLHVQRLAGVDKVQHAVGIQGF